jgi:class 3 adenylate cyclase
MNTITHYELYQVSGDQWAMAARFTRSEREIALSEARRLEEERKAAAAVIEENEEMSGGHFDVRMIYKSVTAASNIRPPASGSDLGTRMFMIALNAITIGAIAMVVGAVLLSRAAFNPTLFNAALLGTFAGFTLISGLLLFRLYIPVGVILWRAKDPESRRRTMQALAQGRVESSLNDIGTMDIAEPEPARRPQESTVQHTAPPPPSVPELPPTLAEAPAPAEADLAPSPETATETAAPAPSTAESNPSADATTAAAALGEQARTTLLEGLKPALIKFADECFSVLATARAAHSATDRPGANLYLLGAATAVAERNGLDDTVVRQLTEMVLERGQTAPQDVAAFFSELEVAGERPRYKRMIDDGKAAMLEALGEPPPAPLTPFVDLIARWSDPAQRGAEAQQMTFLLTDMVGSTAMTSEIGNAGAQRVVRAHNTIVRAAAKAFRGREVKHTGDGMLLIFPDSTTAARAAIDIQQEATTFAADNPTAPLALRIGLHTGEAVFEDGEYYGPAISIVNGICALVSTTEICCSVSVRQKIPSSFRVEDLGATAVKGAANLLQVFKLIWEPKRVSKKPALEYRLIGGVSPPTAAAAGSDSQ